jgi:hypothetical protein
MRKASFVIALSACTALGCGTDAHCSCPIALASGGSGGGDAGPAGSTGGAGTATGGALSGGAGGSGNGGSAGNAGGSGASGGGGSPSGGASGSGGAATGGTTGTSPGASPTIAGCPIFPANNIFNTPIDKLPVHPQSAAFMGTIGQYNIHLDLGMSENMAKPSTYYGIPYNVVHGGTLTWANVAYTSAKNLGWDPTGEADCASGASHALVSPCTAAAAPSPLLPIPSGVLVEGGVFPDVSTSPYGDHHILLLDADTCQLWEAYHAYTGASGTWDIFGSAHFDLRSNALRPAGWTSADAAGFPIMPLLLKADEASSGTIQHALRLTIDSASIRTEYTWPARHLTNNGTASTALPPMGQLFRIKASYVIPSGYSVQSKAILQALKTYGVYLADGGTNLYIQGEPSAKWSGTILDEVQSVGSDQFEAVDLGPIQKRAGFDANSAAVPP